jgi:hypothetical protein
MNSAQPFKAGIKSTFLPRRVSDAMKTTLGNFSPSLRVAIHLGPVLLRQSGSRIDNPVAAHEERQCVIARRKLATAARARVQAYEE